jgi:hypothetical protein
MRIRKYCFEVTGNIRYSGSKNCCKGILLELAGHVTFGYRLQEQEINDLQYKILYYRGKNMYLSDYQTILFTDISG